MMAYLAVSSLSPEALLKIESDKKLVSDQLALLEGAESIGKNKERLKIYIPVWPL